MSGLDPKKNYPKTWHKTQEQIDAYDDLMRKKQNYQKTDYAQNGELMCFGLSEHSLTENLPKFSELARKDLDLMKSWYDNSHDEILQRPPYKSDWSIEDAYDDLMRKKQNYQKTDYAQNGELMCFGLSEHSLTENLPKFSELARKDLDLMKSWYDNSHDEILQRPAYKSDWSMSKDLWRTQLRTGLAIMLLRELPIKSYVSRCVLVYFLGVYWVGRGLSKGLRSSKPAVYYLQPYAIKGLLNRPDLLNFALTRKLPKLPITHDTHKEWRLRQTPVYHQYHRTTYRYRFRKPRYVPWDGTMHQPVMPFLVDDGTDVINGTFRRNANTSPNLK